MTVVVDLSGLNHDLAALLQSLRSTGQDGDFHALLRSEAGQLAWEISNQLGPKSKSAANTAVRSNVAQSLSFQPEYIHLAVRKDKSFTDKPMPSMAHAGFTWLAVGKTWLLGINDEDNQPRASLKLARKYHYAAIKNPRSKTYEQIGMRGVHHIKRLNRVRVSRSTFRATIRSIERKIGQLRASFARTAQELVPLKRIPGWVQKQISEVKSNGKSVYDPARLNDPDAPSIAFGAIAIGVVENAVIHDKIRGAVGRRSKSLAYKVKKILSGWAYRFDTGAVYKPQLGE